MTVEGLMDQAISLHAQDEGNSLKLLQLILSLECRLSSLGCPAGGALFSEQLKLLLAQHCLEYPHYFLEWASCLWMALDGCVL